MLRFNREKILPLFLSRGITMQELGRLAEVHATSAKRAINGARVTAPVIGRVARALRINALDYLLDEKD